MSLVEAELMLAESAACLQQLCSMVRIAHDPDTDPCGSILIATALLCATASRLARLAE